MEKRKKRVWLYLCGAFALLHLLLYAVPLILDHDPDWLSGFRGNVVAGVLGSLFFLVLGFYLNQEFEELQAETHDVVVEMQKIQKSTHEVVIEVGSIQRATNAQTRRQEKVAHFVRFLHREAYHDVRFPNLKTKGEPLGLQYTITPVRENGQPRRYTTEMSESYVVKVLDIAFREELEPEQLREYGSSPIKVGEYYFCGFYNDAWHMGPEDHHLEHEFYLSGKLGHVEHVISANDFIGENNPPGGSRSLGMFVVVSDGTRAGVGVGGAGVELFEAPGPSFYVKINSAPPKRLDMTVVPPEVEDLDGYFATAEARERFRSTLLDQIKGSRA